MRFLNFREWDHQANFLWPDERNTKLQTEGMTVSTSGGTLSKEAAPNSGSELWHKCSTR
jgi:hypothetical protein